MPTVFVKLPVYLSSEDMPHLETFNISNIMNYRNRCITTKLFCYDVDLTADEIRQKIEEAEERAYDKSLVTRNKELQSTLKHYQETASQEIQSLQAQLEATKKEK